MEKAIREMNVVEIKEYNDLVSGVQLVAFKTLLLIFVMELTNLD